MERTVKQKGKGTKIEWTFSGKTGMVVTNERWLIRKLDKYSDDPESDWARHDDDENGNAVYTFKKGMVSLRCKSRTMTDEQKKAISERLKAARESK